MHEMSGLVGSRVRDVNSFLCKHLVTECNLYLKHIMCPLGSPLQQSRFLRASQLLSIRFAQRKQTHSCARPCSGSVAPQGSPPGVFQVPARGEHQPRPPCRKLATKSCFLLETTVTRRDAYRQATTAPGGRCRLWRRRQGPAQTGRSGQRSGW